MRVGIQLLGIGVRLVEVEEAADAHLCQPVGLLDLDVEVAHHEAGEVVEGHLVEQLVLVQAVLGIGQQEDEVAEAFVAEFPFLRRGVLLRGGRPAAPDVAGHILPVAQRAAFLDPLYDVLRHLRHLVLRVFLDDFFQRDQEAVALSRVELAHGADEHELGAVRPFGEVVGGHVVVAEHFLVFVPVVGFVGGGIQGVLDVLALAGVKLILGVGQHDGIPAFGEFLDELLFVQFRPGQVAQASADEEQMVVYVVLVGHVGELVDEAQQGLAGQHEILQPLHLQDAGLVERVAQDVVGGLQLLLGERNLLQVVFAVVGVAGQRVGHAGLHLGDAVRPRDAVGLRHQQAVALLAVVVLAELVRAVLCLVASPPVVLQRAPSPDALELPFALCHDGGVVEIPHARLPLSGRRAGALGRGTCGRGGGSLRHVGSHFGVHGLAGLLLFLLLQFLDDVVDGFVALRLGEFGQPLQAVLQLDGGQVRLHFRQGCRTAFHLLVVLMLLVEDAHQFGIAPLRVDIVLLVPVDAAQPQEQHRLGDAVLRAFLGALLIRADAVGRVVVGQVDVADGVVNLVLVVLVLLVAGHAAQFLHHLAVVAGGHGFGLQDLCVERQLVGRVGADDPPQGLVGFRLLPRLVVQLSQQEVQAGLLFLVPLFPDGLLQVGDGFLVLPHGDEVVRIRGVELPCALVADAVAPDFLEHVLRIVGPFHFHVATGQPGTGHGDDFRLGGVERANVVEERSRLDEVALLELGLPHQQPGVAQEGVELLAGQVGFLGLRLPLVHVRLGAGLDGVLLDGFLAFLDGGLEVGFPHGGGGLAPHVVHGQQLGVVVLMPLLLGQDAFLEGLAAVEVRVEPCRHGMVEAASRRVLLGGTCREKGEQDGSEGDDM